MKKQHKIVAGILACIVVVFLLAKGGYKEKEVSTTKTPTAPPAALEVRANDWSLGDTNAKVTIIEYLDFECEACGAFYPIIKQIKEEYGDSVRLVVRYFPLPGHKNSKTAAYAAEAAGKQGKFWEMYDVLFTKQEQWGNQQITNQSQFETYALEAGVDVEQWKKDVASAEVMKRVNDSYAEAVSLKLQSTPSFFLNGKKIDNPRGYSSFKLLIDNAINK